mmetsp:Transcript_105103/g.279694  ORF Transcript_105103/g.279694 Transcript_105103/m.279694 type:complete len:317 (-) Transcript_105103:277-1227(-)
MRSSSANLAMSCCRILSSSARAFVAFSSFSLIWNVYAFFMSSLSSSLLRTWISSRLRASASSSSKCKSFRSCSSSPFSLLLASITPSMAFRIFCFSCSALSFSSANLFSCSRFSRAKASILSFSSSSAISMASCLAFCSVMNLLRISLVSFCLCIRAWCSSASSCAIFSTSSWTWSFSLRYSAMASSLCASFMAICCWLMCFTRSRCLVFSMPSLCSNSMCSSRSSSMCSAMRCSCSLCCSAFTECWTSCCARSLFTLAMCSLSLRARSSSLPSQMRRLSMSWRSCSAFLRASSSARLSSNWAIWVRRALSCSPFT